MSSRPRYLLPQVQADLTRKMVFVAGPRQVGKTTLARQVLGESSGYLNWDVAEDREHILRREFPSSDLWVLDEIHKFRLWRALLKGLWDGRRPAQKILVTGSANLDFYRHGGDSLQGRYHLVRLHPLSVAELGISTAEDLRGLLQLGGFPEPFFSGSEKDSRRWSREYRTRLVYDDLNSLEKVADLGRVELLLLALSDRVGSPLSLNSLREDLQVSHATVARHVEILQELYALFRLSPLGSPLLRAVKKEQKHYHLDWTVVGNEAARFENLVACHLLKWVHHQQDTEGRDLELRYFRDVDGREVDFVLTERGQVLQLVEVKWGDAPLDRGIRYLKERFPAASAWQVSAMGTRDFVSPEGIRVCPALVLLREGV